MVTTIINEMVNKSTCSFLLLYVVLIVGQTASKINDLTDTQSITFFTKSTINDKISPTRQMLFNFVTFTCSNTNNTSLGKKKVLTSITNLAMAFETNWNISLERSNRLHR